MKNSALVRIDIRAMLEGLNGDIIPSLYGNNNYSGDVYIRPSNIGVAKISIAKPTIYKVKIYPTKDLYIDKNNAILNFGNAQSLIINRDRYSSYMSFSLNKIPLNAVIESAKLNVYKENYTNSNTIDVYSTSNEYDEIGLTYLNAPAKQDKLFSQTLPNNSGYITRDILNYTINWYDNNKSDDKAFTISSNVNENLILQSKEGTNPPYIEVEYFIQNQNIGINEVYGEIYPICVRDKIYNGEIYVESNIRENYVLGDIQIDNVNITSDVLQGEILIENSNNLTYDGEINVLSYSDTVETSINEIIPVIAANVKYSGEIDIQLQSDSIDFNGEILVEKSLIEEYDGEINILKQKSEYAYDGEIIVQYNSSLNYIGEVNILKQKSEYAYSGEILVEYESSNKYNGEIDIQLQSNSIDFNGEILVEHQSSTEYDGNINILKQLNDIEYCGEIDIQLQSDSIDFNGEIILSNERDLFYNGDINIIEYNSSTEYHGEILVEFDSTVDYCGQINILTQSNENHYDGEINIKTITEDYTFIGEIEPTVPYYTTISGEIYVDNSGHGYEIISGDIYVIKSKSSGYVFIL